MEYVEDFFTHGVKAFTTPRVPKDHYIRIEAKGRVKKVAVSAEHPLQEVKVGQRAVMSFLVDPNARKKKARGDAYGYRLLRDTFSITFGDKVSVKLQEPWPEPTQEPLFVMYEHEWRDHYLDPHHTQDGFQIGFGGVFPSGLPLAVPSLPEGRVHAGLDLMFKGGSYPNMHDSKILAAVGEYATKGILGGEEAMQIWGGSKEKPAMMINFEQMHIHPPAMRSTSTLLRDPNGELLVPAADATGALVRMPAAAVSTTAVVSGAAAGALLATLFAVCWGGRCRGCGAGGASQPRERAPPRRLSVESLFGAAPARLAKRRTDKRESTDSGVLGTLPPQRGALGNV